MRRINIKTVQKVLSYLLDLDMRWSDTDDMYIGLESFGTTFEITISHRYDNNSPSHWVSEFEDILNFDDDIEFYLTTSCEGVGRFTINY